MNVLFVASEIFPYAKTGGLADVADALPKALHEHIAVSRVMPLYGFMSKTDLCLYDNFTLELEHRNYSVRILEHKEDGIVTYFVEAPFLSETSDLYGDSHGDYKDNALRFGIFCKAVVVLALRLNITLIHVNDWHSALIPLFVKDLSLKIKTLFTIHNLAYQGVFEQSVLERLGIDDKYFTMEGIEFYHQVNFLKAGIAYADAVTTVSPSYAKEILTPEFGCGLDGFLQAHQKKLFGILNGIDTAFFNPRHDTFLSRNYDADTLQMKKDNKEHLSHKRNIKNSHYPLFVMISRLAEQKGIALLIKTLPLLQKKKLNIFLLGDGDTALCTTLEELAAKFDNFYFLAGYDEELSHQAYGAADFLLMPSRFEPCGLNQFIAMRYAALPLVHAVGGLKDSVHEKEIGCGQGLVYQQQNPTEFTAAILRALKLYRDKKSYRKIQKFNMQCDFSFAQSAVKYIEHYRALV